MNLTTQPVELDEVNGGGLLFPHVEGETGHERELTKVTARERDLEAAGLIELVGKAKTGDTPAPGDQPEKGGEA